MFLFGIVLSLPGTVLGLPELADALGLSLAQRGTLISTLFAGLLVGSFTSGPLVDALGQRAALLLCTALTGVSLPLLGTADASSPRLPRSPRWGLVAAGVNTTAANALSSELFPAERGRRMNGIAVMVGLGGLTMPAVTALTSGSVSWRAVLMAAGLLAFAVAGVGAALSRGAVATRAAADAPGRAVALFFAQRNFLWFCLLLVLCGGNEASVAGWTSTYLGVSGFEASTATLVLASHWLGLVLGRVIFSSRVDRDKSGAVVRGAVAVAAGIVLLVATRMVPVLAVTPFLIGVALSIVMPTVLAIAGESFAGNAGTLFGLLLTMAQVGGIAAPAVIGAVAEVLGVRAGLLVVAANALVVAGVTRLVR
jgi:MFS family permease